MSRKNVKINLGLNLPAVRDLRTIPLRSILNLPKLPVLPNHFSVDEDLDVNNTDIFGNDQYGDCVKVAMTHQTLRFEKFEQGILVPITTQEVVDEYFRESGGSDSGLWLHYAMKDWRSTGLTFNNKNYKIYAYADVTPTDHAQVRYSIFLLRGLIMGMQVYSADIDQFHNGEVWHLTGKNGAFEGGHGVYVYKYNIGGPATQTITLSDYHKVEMCGEESSNTLDVPEEITAINYDDDILECITWGERQVMTAEFWNARVSQAYAVVDNVNPWMKDDSPVNVKEMDRQLREITGAEEPKSGCCVAKAIKRILE